jgi:aminoglycoside 6'-N-acetyltransferase I
MTDIQIRPARPSDAKTWLALRNTLWPSDDHPSEIAAYFDGKIDEPSLVLLGFVGIKPIALLELSIRYDVEGAAGIRTGYIEGLYVVPGARSFRLNRRLVEVARQWALRQHCIIFGSDRAGRVVLTSKWESTWTN